MVAKFLSCQPDTHNSFGSLRNGVLSFFDVPTPSWSPSSGGAGDGPVSITRHRRSWRLPACFSPSNEDREKKRVLHGPLRESTPTFSEESTQRDYSVCFSIANRHLYAGQDLAVVGGTALGLLAVVQMQIGHLVYAQGHGWGGRGETEDPAAQRASGSTTTATTAPYRTFSGNGMRHRSGGRAIPTTVSWMRDSDGVVVGDCTGCVHWLRVTCSPPKGKGTGLALYKLPRQRSRHSQEAGSHDETNRNSSLYHTTSSKKNHHYANNASSDESREVPSIVREWHDGELPGVFRINLLSRLVLPDPSPLYASDHFPCCQHILLSSPVSIYVLKADRGDGLSLLAQLPLLPQWNVLPPCYRAPFPAEWHHGSCSLYCHPLHPLIGIVSPVVPATTSAFGAPAAPHQPHYGALLQLFVYQESDQGGPTLQRVSFRIFPAAARRASLLHFSSSWKFSLELELVLSNCFAGELLVVRFTPRRPSSPVDLPVWAAPIKDSSGSGGSLTSPTEPSSHSSTQTLYEIDHIYSLLLPLSSLSVNVEYISYATVHLRKPRDRHAASGASSFPHHRSRKTHGTRESPAWLGPSVSAASFSRVAQRTILLSAREEATLLPLVHHATVTQEGQLARHLFSTQQWKAGVGGEKGFIRGLVPAIFEATPLHSPCGYHLDSSAHRSMQTLLKKGKGSFSSVIAICGLTNKMTCLPVEIEPRTHWASSDGVLVSLGATLHGASAPSLAALTRGPVCGCCGGEGEAHEGTGPHRVGFVVNAEDNVKALERLVRASQSPHRCRERCSVSQVITRPPSDGSGGEGGEMKAEDLTILFKYIAALERASVIRPIDDVPSIASFLLAEEKGTMPLAERSKLVLQLIGYDRSPSSFSHPVAGETPPQIEETEARRGEHLERKAAIAALHQDYVGAAEILLSGGTGGAAGVAPSVNSSPPPSTSAAPAPPPLHEAVGRYLSKPRDLVYVLVHSELETLNTFLSRLSPWLLACVLACGGSDVEGEVRMMEAARVTRPFRERLLYRHPSLGFWERLAMILLLEVPPVQRANANTSGESGLTSPPAPPTPSARLARLLRQLVAENAAGPSIASANIPFIAMHAGISAESAPLMQEIVDASPNFQLASCLYARVGVRVRSPPAWLTAASEEASGGGKDERGEARFSPMDAATASFSAAPMAVEALRRSRESRYERSRRQTRLNALLNSHGDHSGEISSVVDEDGNDIGVRWWLQWAEGYRSFLDTEHALLERTEFDISVKKLREAFLHAEAAGVGPRIHVEKPWKPRGGGEGRKSKSVSVDREACGESVSGAEVTHTPDWVSSPSDDSGIASTLTQASTTAFLQRLRAMVCNIQQSRGVFSERRCGVCGVNAIGCSVKEARDPAEAVLNMWVHCGGCGHGGHREHIQQWFAVHRQCPVEACSCSCNDL